MKPLIVFSGGKQEVKRLKEKFKKDAMDVSTGNGWVDEEVCTMGA